jgi:glutathione reductase (NADPH)
MSRFDFDLFTIGAGSGGVRASRMAAGHGARVAVAEAGRLGGTCVNVGCVPKKLLMYASQFSSAFEDARGFSWTVGEQSFDWQRLIADKDREIERLNRVYQGLLEGAGVEIIGGRARLLDRHTVEVDGTAHTARNILIATGARPHPMEIPGTELGISSDDLFYLPELPRRITIVGGGYIAVEFAGIFNGMGSEVTLLYRGPMFLRGFDDDVREALAREMALRGIEIRFSTQPTRIERDGALLWVETDAGDRISADQLLCATGRVPNTANLGLEELGVELAPNGAVIVDRFSESTVPGIHAIGDCTDRRALTPVALAEAMALVETLFASNPTAVDYSNVPTAVFSQPQVGTVGLTESEARAAGLDVQIFRSSFRPMLHTMSGRDEQALMKLVVDRTSDRVLGVHMVAPDAGEIIQGFAVALKCGATKKQFDATIGVHPTAAEEFVTMREPVEGI